MLWCFNCGGHVCSASEPRSPPEFDSLSEYTNCLHEADENQFNVTKACMETSSESLESSDCAGEWTVEDSSCIGLSSDRDCLRKQMKASTMKFSEGTDCLNGADKKQLEVASVCAETRYQRFVSSESGQNQTMRDASCIGSGSVSHSSIKEEMHREGGSSPGEGAEQDTIKAEKYKQKDHSRQDSMNKMRSSSDSRHPREDALPSIMVNRKEMETEGHSSSDDGTEQDLEHLDLVQHDEIMRSTTSESEDLDAKESTPTRSCQAEASSDGSLQSVCVGRYPDKLYDKLSFCYWISEQQRDLMFLTAGIVIQAVGFQLKSMVDVISMLIALGSHAYSSVCRVAHGIPQHDMRAIEAHADLEYRFVMFMKRLANLAALLIAEGKKMGLGCLKIAYVLGIIAAIILMSFTLSFVLMKAMVPRRMEPLHMTYHIHFDYTQLHPAAALHLLHLRVHHADSLAKRKNDVDPGHIHNRCTIMLTLPESDYNRKLGVFQLVAELLSETGDVLMKSSQPCLLHFKSTALQYVKSVCLAIPLLAGLTSEAQTLRVHLLKWKQDEFMATPSSLQISLVPRMGRSGTNGLPELYKAEIELHAMDSLEPSPIATTIRNLCIWVIFNFLFFGLFSSVCMFKMCRQRKNDVPSADSLAQTEASATCKRWQPAEKVI